MITIGTIGRSGRSMSEDNSLSFMEYTMKVLSIAYHDTWREWMKGLLERSAKLEGGYIIINPSDTAVIERLVADDYPELSKEDQRNANIGGARAFVYLTEYLEERKLEDTELP